LDARPGALDGGLTRPNRLGYPSGVKDSVMDKDDLPPKPANDAPDESSFSGMLGMTFAGAAWVAVFAAIAGAFLWAVIHWFT
jgi:hypothetical protein